MKKRITSDKNNEPKRRKRINSIKHTIVIGAVLLVLVSLILNMVLVVKVVNLDRKVKELNTISYLYMNKEFVS